MCDIYRSTYRPLSTRTPLLGAKSIVIIITVLGVVALTMILACGCARHKRSQLRSIRETRNLHQIYSVQHVYTVPQQSLTAETNMSAPPGGQYENQANTSHWYDPRVVDRENSAPPAYDEAIGNDNELPNYAAAIRMGTIV